MPQGYDKEQVAAVLAEIGTLLELQGENAFRCQAYHNAARAIGQMEEDLGTVVAQGRLTDIPGIGATLRDKITQLVTTGTLRPSPASSYSLSFRPYCWARTRMAMACSFEPVK